MEETLITITCKMCGSHDFQRDGETYVCKGCGRRYGPHELLMLSSSPSPADDERKATEYLASAMAAHQAGNYYEAEVWCDRALSLERENYQALRLKAVVVSKQVSDQDERTLDAIRCFSEALDAAPEDCRESLRTESGECISNAVFTHVVTQCARYAKGILDPVLNPVILLPNFVQDRAARLIEATGTDILTPSFRAAVAIIMNNSAIEVWSKTVYPAYASDERRGEEAMLAFVREGANVIAIIEKAINFAPDDDAGNLARYRNAILIGRELIDAHSMRPQGRRWVRDLSLADDTNRHFESKIEQWTQSARAIDPNFQVVPSTHAGFVTRGSSSKKARATANTSSNAATGTIPNASEGTGPLVTPSTNGDAGSKSVWSHTVDWKVLGALLCFSRFLSMLNKPITLEALIWLSLGVMLAMLWFRSE